MADNNPFEIPPQIRELTEKNIEQFRLFYDQWMQGVTSAMSMWSATPAGQAAPGFDGLRNRAVQFAKENADAAFALAQELAKAASEGEVCASANDNAPGQVVISGTRAAIERAVALAPKFGARRAVLLPVSAPFHCALMQPAAAVMREALSEVKISTPSVQLVANVLATAISDPEAIRARLIEQVTGMVRWRESMLYLRDQGVDSLYEIGAGRVLTGLARRFEGFEARSVGTPEELEAAAAALQARDA